jgi:hypothetical protein
VQISGPSNWNGGNPLIAGVFQPAGTPQNRSVWWSFVAPISGPYLAQSLINGAIQQGFSIDATSVISTPMVVSLSLLGAGQVQIDWDSPADNESCLVRVNDVPFPGVLVADYMVPCAQESFVFTGLPLVAGTTYQASVFAFSQDVLGAGSIGAVFNIGSDDTFFVATASSAAVPSGASVRSTVLSVPPSPPR